MLFSNFLFIPLYAMWSITAYQIISVSSIRNFQGGILKVEWPFLFWIMIGTYNIAHHLC